MGTIFHTFESKEARRAWDGSAFIELQYCKMKPRTRLGKIFRSVDYWQENSLYVYVDDMDCFWTEYGDILTDCIRVRGNRSIWEMDLYGFNYFSPIRIKNIIDLIEKQKPLDYTVLAEWLKQSSNFNGIYVLGI